MSPPASNSHDLPAHYARVRDELVRLAGTLEPGEVSMLVPACPEWTVRNVYAHLAGSNADILAGNLDGVATDPWTQRQVDDRRTTPLADIVAEWVGHAPRIDSLLVTVGEAMDPRLYIDQWTHEQDIRGAVSRPGPVDPEFVSWAVDVIAPGMVVRTHRSGIGELELVVDGRRFAREGADITARLELNGYDALRLAVGRRSHRQMAALDWSIVDDPTPYLEHLVVFSASGHDIVDAHPAAQQG